MAKMTSGFENIKRGVTAIEKGFNRFVRSKYSSPAQYPPIIPIIKETIDNMHIWLDNREEIVSRCVGSYVIIFTLIAELESLINQLRDIVKPRKGVKRQKKKQRIIDQENLAGSITAAIEKISKTLNELKDEDNEIREAFEKGLEKSFDKDILRPFRKKIKKHISERGEKTHIFKWDDIEKYHSFIKNKARFRAEVVEKLPKGENSHGHKESCKGPKKYNLCGYRGNPRKTKVDRGKKETFNIRMAECKGCGQRFSLLPSFLPREKNYGMDTIGIVCRALYLRSNSIQSVFEQTEHMGKNRIKSRQTIIDWMRWFGMLDPAKILTDAGIKGTGYLQEDEGFEKEPNLRTYSIIMIDPKTQLVWHLRLCRSC